MEQVSYRKLTNSRGHWRECSRPGSVCPWPKSKSLEAGGKPINKRLQLQRSAYRVLLAKFSQLTQPADVQILSNASCTSDATSSEIICVLLPMYAALYALFPWGFLTRLETRQLMGRRQYFYGMLIADEAGRCKWWRNVTSFGVESGARLWSAHTHTHTYTHTFLSLQQSRGWVRVVQWCTVRSGVWPCYWTLRYIVTEFHNQQ